MSEENNVIDLKPNNYKKILSEKVRKKSQARNIFCIILSIIMLCLWIFSNFIHLIKSSLIIESSTYLMLLGIFGLLYGILNYVDVNTTNKRLENSPYNFDYIYNLKCYSSIACGKEILLDNKKIEKLNNYTDWENYIYDYISKTYQPDDAKNVINFSHYLNRIYRSVLDIKEFEKTAFVPIGLAFVANLLNKTALSNFNPTINAFLIVFCIGIVVIIYAYDYGKYSEELHFLEDLELILNTYITNIQKK